MQFGIDNQFWTIGPKFKGVKLVPFGAHFVYYSLKDEHHAHRQGFWVMLSAEQSVVVKTFSTKVDRFVDLPA